MCGVDQVVACSSARNCDARQRLGPARQDEQIRKENRPESEMDALFNEERKHEEQMLGSEKYAGRVGAFEGANYESKGYYRPQTNCIMFTEPISSAESASGPSKRS